MKMINSEPIAGDIRIMCFVEIEMGLNLCPWLHKVEQQPKRAEWMHCECQS